MQHKDAYKKAWNVCMKYCQCPGNCVYANLLYGDIPFKESKRKLATCPNEHQFWITGVRINEAYMDVHTLRPNNSSPGNPTLRK